MTTTQSSPLLLILSSSSASSSSFSFLSLRHSGLPVAIAADSESDCDLAELLSFLTVVIRAADKNTSENRLRGVSFAPRRQSKEDRM